MMKCPICNKKLVRYIENGYIITKCNGRNPCNYYHKIKLK